MPSHPVSALALVGAFATVLLAAAAPQQALAAKTYNASHSNTAHLMLRHSHHGRVPQRSIHRFKPSSHRDVNHGAYSGKRRHNTL
jgi:hypothetical protein